MLNVIFGNISGISWRETFITLIDNTFNKELWIKTLFMQKKSFNIIRSRKSKMERDYNCKERTKGQTVIYTTLHRKLKTEHLQPIYYQG
jgi:hypothetical protein